MTAPTTEASPPSTFGDDGQRDAPSIMSCCGGRQREGSELVLGLSTSEVDRVGSTTRRTV